MREKMLKKNKSTAKKLGASTAGADEVHIVHGKGNRSAVWIDGTSLHRFTRETKIIGGKSSAASIPLERVVTVETVDLDGGMSRVVVSGSGAGWSVSGDRINMAGVAHMVKMVAARNRNRGE